MKQSNFFLAIVILALLVSSTSFAASAADPRAPEELKKILDAPPPDPKEHSKAALTKIYMERGRAASTLGDLDTVIVLTIALTIASSAGQLFSASAPGGEQSTRPQAILDAPVPDPNATPKAGLVKIYMGRAQAAGALGDVDRQFLELNEGIRLIGPKDPLAYELYNLAGRTHPMFWTPFVVFGDGG